MDFEVVHRRVLVPEYPIQEGERITPIFPLFINRAIQHALADGEEIIHATSGWLQTRVPMWCDLDDATRSVVIGSRQPDRNGAFPSRPIQSPSD